MPRRSILLMGLAIMVVIGIATDLSWRAYTRPRLAVVVDGRTLGAIRNPELAAAVLQAVMAQITPEMELHVNLPDKLLIRPLDERERLVSASADAIESALVRTIPSLSSAVAIMVNGQDVVAVSDAKSAQAVRDQILDEYKATILRDATAVEQVKFQETITWRPKLVKHENVRTVEDAIRMLKHGTDKLVTHVVKSGDTGWDIARSYNVTTDQLAKANPTLDLDLLRIGQAINVTFKEPYVHTQSVSKRAVKDGIPFTEEIVKDSSLWPWQYEVVTPGAPGTRQLVIREYRENGRIVKSDVLENLVLEKPKVQVARQGTKQIPTMGTGSLVYPVSGVTTSAFGPRWGGFHSGIDIGAPTGTPILAADSGMVVFRGWAGNYGYLVKIDHGEGRMVTWYGHLSAFNVEVGDRIDKGDVIGYVGNTGYSTGPHLHYEVHIDGASVNPLKYYQ